MKKISVVQNLTPLQLKAERFFNGHFLFIEDTNPVLAMAMSNTIYHKYAHKPLIHAVNGYSEKYIYSKLYLDIIAMA